MIIAGDEQHDSMGHNAKYCAYTVFCCTIPLIIDFSLVQVWSNISIFFSKLLLSCCVSDSFLHKRVLQVHIHPVSNKV